MTNTRTFTAVVRNSSLNDPHIEIINEDHVVLWLDLPGRSLTLDNLTQRLLASEFVVAGEWRTNFGNTDMSLTVEVRTDRLLL